MGNVSNVHTYKGKKLTRRPANARLGIVRCLLDQLAIQLIAQLFRAAKHVGQQLVRVATAFLLCVAVAHVPRDVAV